MQGNIFVHLEFWNHSPLHPRFSPPPKLSPHYILNSIATSHFSLIWIRLELPAFFWFLQVDIPTHVTFFDKWSFWDDFWTPLKLFSAKRFSKWISLVVSTLFSYYIRSYSTSNCTYPWNGSPFLLGGVHPIVIGGNIVSINKTHFMLSIPRHLCNTIFPTPF
jgi:hypothetical protein